MHAGASIVLSATHNRYGRAQSTPQQNDTPPRLLPSFYPHGRDYSIKPDYHPNLTVTWHDLQESPRPERLLVHGVAVDPGDDLPCALLPCAHHAPDLAGREVLLLVLLEGKRRHHG